MYMIYLYQGDTPVSFMSHPTPSLKYPRTPIPFVLISSHPNCEYTCDSPQDKNMEFPLLPVIFVDQPLFFFNALSVLMVMKSLLPFLM